MRTHKPPHQSARHHHEYLRPPEPNRPYPPRNPPNTPHPRLPTIARALGRTLATATQLQERLHHHENDLTTRLTHERVEWAARRLLPILLRGLGTAFLLLAVKYATTPATPNAACYVPYYAAPCLTEPRLAFYSLLTTLSFYSLAWITTQARKGDANANREPLV